MENKKLLESLLLDLRKATGKKFADISIEMGYGSNYISKILGPSGTVTPKFLRAFKEKYRDFIGEDIRIKGKGKDLRTDSAERLLVTEARLDALEAILKEIYAKVEGLPFSSASLQVDGTISKALSQRLDELNKP